VDKRLRAPFPWYGGKHFMVNKLLPLIPKHHTYVEVFGGASCGYKPQIHLLNKKFVFVV